MSMSHPKCHGPDGHVCQQPSGRECIEPLCREPAGTLWGPLWYPAHDQERLDRITASLESIAASFGSEERRADG